VALETRYPASDRSDRNVGNIYERLDAARRKREKVLETPTPANDDRETMRQPIPAASRAFPNLKPPRRDVTNETAPPRWDWAVPWLLGLAIFAVIFVFAVR
jgi:hypothetical protein